MCIIPSASKFWNPLFFSSSPAKPVPAAMSMTRQDLRSAPSGTKSASFAAVLSGEIQASSARVESY